MNEIVLSAKVELETLSNTSKDKHIRTGDIRKLSANLFCNVKDKSKENIFAICGELLE